MDKILIVDDEQPVLEGIKVLIAKYFEGVSCDTASTGSQALEKVHNTHPDIILMDVKMPGMSGIEAIREIRSISPQSIVILVTAYERFEIAKDAMSLGVQNYLLKPVSRDALVEVLGAALEKVRSLRGQQRREVSFSDWRQSATIFLEQALLFHLAGYGAISDIEAILGLLGFDARRGCVLWTEWQQVSELDPRKAFDGWQEQVRFKMRCAIGSWKTGRAGLFFSTTASRFAWESLPPFPTDVQWRASLGSVEDLDTLGRSYQQALWRLERAPWGHVLDVDPPTQRLATLYFPYDLEKLLLKAVLRGDVEHIVPSLTSLWEAWEHLTTPERTLTDLVLETVTVLVHHQASDEKIGIPPDEIAVLEGVLNDPNRHDQREVFQQFLVRWALAPRTEISLSPIVEKALKFTRDNFDRGISLEETAAAVGVHSQYLSRLLNQERGESFVDLVTRLRIAKARELLMAGRSVKETAADLGYADPNYFSRLFKKWEGITPGEFADGRRKAK